MAFRGVRIPRLTLYSGPNCSLCDTAKLALAKVRQTTPFELDTVNIQDKGQEKWKRKYVYWIPALHLEGQEIAKGRWDESVVIQALKEWKEQQAQAQIQPQTSEDKQETAPFDAAPSFFIHSTPDLLPPGWEQQGIYHRASHTILGETHPEDDAQSPPPDKDKDKEKDTPRCFNCGSASHKLPDCPARIDRDLVALTRQYFHFFQGTLGLTGWKRVHTVEAWRQQRLTWVDEFTAGQVTGALLKEALLDEYDGLASDEWLRNISVWGYPRGWHAQKDPREEVRRRIWEENGGVVDPDMEDASPFEIHGDNDVVERVSFHRAFDYKVLESASAGAKDLEETHSDSTTTTSDSDGDASNADTDSERSHTLSRSLSPALPPAALPYIRWANYPASYFSSDHLVLYTPPPPPPQETWANTSFENTEAYLYQFYYRPQPPPPPPTEEPPPLPPASCDGHPPPPPPDIPPPPPPPEDPPPPPPPPGASPPPSYSPPLIVTLLHPDTTSNISTGPTEDESDMDLSDSD